MKNGRKVFLETLTELAEKDPAVILIIGDVGFSFIETYKERFPKQFVNVGVLEQTMMGFAAGIAKEGGKPYVYTMIPFICFRPYEQVRNDIAWGNANVKLLGVQGSEAYSFLGRSHNIYDDEDKKLMNHLPNLKTHFPETEEDLRVNLLKEYNRLGPAYFRI